MFCLNEVSNVNKYWRCLFHCFTVHFVSQSFTCTNSCTCFQITLKSLKTLLLNYYYYYFNKSVLSDLSDFNVT